MKIKRGTAAVFICICMILSAFPAFSASVPTIYVKDAMAGAGEAVTVDVMISDNPGFNTFRFGFDYDTTAMTLDSVKLSTRFPGQFMYIKKAVWVASSDNFTNGTVLTLTFNVSKDAACGDYPVSVTFSPGDICNFSEQLVSFSSIPGKVSVVNMRPGDINRDGKINAVDSNLLKSLVLGNVALTPDEIKNADLNGDGKLNAIDTNLIKSIILGN